MIRTFGKWLISAVLAVAALLLTVWVLFLFNPKWQAQAVDAVLEEATGWQWDFATVNLGWNRVQATGVFAMKNAQGFEIGQAEVGLQTISLLRANPVLVRGGELRECFLDLSLVPLSAIGVSVDDLALDARSGEMEVLLDRLVTLSLERLRAQGLRLEVQDLRIIGSALLPQGGFLRFDLTLLEASSEAPDEVRLSVARAEFRD